MSERLAFFCQNLGYSQRFFLKHFCLDLDQKGSFQVSRKLLYLCRFLVLLGYENDFK